MTKVPLKDAVILTDYNTRVLVVRKDDPAVQDRSLTGSYGAVFSNWQTKSDKARMKELMALKQQLGEEGLPKPTIHKAFSSIPEYAERGAAER